MFAQCSVWWHGDDFTNCALREVLQTLIPSIACAISLLLLVYRFAASRLRAKSSHHGYSALKQNGVSGNGSTAYNADPDEDDDDEEETDDEDEPDRSQEVILQNTRSRKLSVTTIDRPKGEVLISAVEEVAVLAVLATQIATLALDAWGSSGLAASAAGVAIWSYIAALTTLRLYFSSVSRPAFAPVWHHTALLYGIQWIITAIAFRSEIIHPHSHAAMAVTSTYFAFSTVLLVIALASRKGNAPVELEYEDGMQPSPEAVASVFGHATFSWVDALLVTGWKHELEQTDLWNLLPEDKAVNVIANYRQLKKTTALAWHLLRHFRHELIIQACWSVIAGIITFVPTMLLYLILEYVEQPESVERGAAWLYVVLLLVSGLVNAVSNGKALWIGRKVCIRLRAIIIGEIYAKALRRRVGSTNDKVLGGQGEAKDNEAASTKTFGEKVKSLMGSKKSKKADATKADAANKADGKKKSDDADDSQVTSGAIINLMAVDSFKVADITAYLHFMWAETPIQFIIAIVLLYQVLGRSSIVGIITMILLLPVNMVIAKKWTTFQKTILAATDARIHTTNEILTNIRIIKYFAWEQRFLGMVDEKRAVELRGLRNRYILWGVAATVWSGAPIIITVLTFMSYTLVERKQLVPSVAFTALSLFNLLRIPLDQIADMVAHVQEAKVSVDRVEEYLNEPETDKYNQLQDDETDDRGDAVIGFDNATFSWGTAGGDDFKMIDLDLRFRVGQLNVVIGPTGSGKTSLLMALLGEMTLMEGEVHLPGSKSREDLRPDPETGLTNSVAFCAQQPWLVNGTIKENIIFASPWDPQRYKQTIVACSLQRDLEILDAGDSTLVGEKGVTLSGGQKQRISLARALYCNAKHVLLDDVLSAVDSHTAKWIFEKALLGPLMYHRTCVLVTHNAVLCLPQAELAVVLDNGRITAQGSASDVIASGRMAEDMSKFESRPQSRGASTVPSRVPSGIGGDRPIGAADDSETRLETLRDGETIETTPAAPNGDALNRVISKDIPGLNKAADSNLPQETKAKGAVKFGIMLSYFSYMGGSFYWVMSALVFVLHQISQVSTNVWIRQWANAYTSGEERASTASYQPPPLNPAQGGLGGAFNFVQSGFGIWNQPLTKMQSISAYTTSSPSDVNVAYYLGIYSLLGFLYILITLARDGLVFYGSLVASKGIHRKLMESVAHAKFRFFDSTPLGQIMNRFSKDVETMDQEVAPAAVTVVHCLFSIITIVILISIITPAFLIAGFFMTILYFLIGAYFVSSSRALKRIESVQRSPLYQQFGETLSGMTTIRAYGDERRFIRDNLGRINSHSRPFIYLWAVNRWLAFRVDIVGAMVAFFSGVFILLSVGRIDAGAAGLALTYAVTFSDNILWFVRFYATNEQNMNAVERVKEYLDVDQEAAAIVEDNRPEGNWPSKGSVEFIGYSTR